MKLPVQSREKTPVAATVLLIAAGIAGWLSVPEAESSGLSPDGADGASFLTAALPGPAGAAAPAPASGPPAASASAVTARFEKELLATLDPGATAYSGERLTELCLADHAEDLPGANAAFDYAARWGRAAPREMHDWFLAQGAATFTLPTKGNANYGFGNMIFSGWAKKDPEAATAAALAAATPNERRNCLANVIETLRATDPERASALTAEHAALLVPGSVGSSVFSAYGDDYRSTWDFLSALPPGKGRGGLLARFLDEMSRYHQEETGKLWKELSPEDRQALVAGGFSGFYFAKAQLNVPLEGLAELKREQASSGGDPAARNTYLRTGALKWAETDPAAAIAWSQEHVTGEARVTGTSRLFRAGAAHQFDATLAAWQALPEGNLRARAAGQLAAGAPAERKAEAEAAMATLSPADQAIAKAAMKDQQGDFQLHGF